MLQSHQQDGDGSGQAPDRTRQGGRGGSATAAGSPGRFLGERRAPRSPPGRTRCTRGRTDSGPAVPGSSNDGTRRSPTSALGQPDHVGRSSPPPWRAGGGECRIKVGAQCLERRGCRGRQRADHQHSALRKVAEAGPDQVPKSPAHPVTDHRLAHGLGHDKAGACRGGLRRLIDKQMDDHRVAPGPAPTANCRGEVSATPQSLRRGQHDYLGFRPDRRRLKPTACRDPWRGEWRGWRGRHGCACAAGNRGSSRAGGCSAGRCACSRQNSVFVGPPEGVQGASKLQDATLAERGGATARPYAALPRWSTITGPARRQGVTRRNPRHAPWSVCAHSESFRARCAPRRAPAVDAGASALLACPFAGLRSAPCRAAQNRTRR
jgi:hypothetical protein